MLLPPYVPLTFGLAVLVAVVLFLYGIARADARKGKQVALATGTLLAGWMLIQSALTGSGFYDNLSAVPTKLSLLIAPPLVALIALFSLRRARNYASNVPLSILTFIHVVRVPVEIVLFWLFVGKLVPVEMTFEGRNFDVISGLTAPFVAYFGVVRGLNRRWLLFWNLVCLGLLVNIVVTAILSVPLPIQRFGFDQPNVALVRFPFVFLPSVVVPIVLFSHLVSIRKLRQSRKAETPTRAVRI